jgi:hypothetical protein
MAMVYQATARSLGTQVAIKVLAPRLSHDPDFRSRFHDEATSLAALHHPNLIEVYYYGEEADLVYISMRLVPEGTLKDRLAQQATFDLVSVARLMRQVADALEHAHAHGLVHLDIKPANILLGRADWPLLADFGITRAQGEPSTEGQPLPGTPFYMSPEQSRGGPVDGRSDEYSLAITAYELLTGQRPFGGTTPQEVLRAQQEDPPPSPRALNPAIPGPVEAVLLKGMAKNPDDRYAHISEFGEALARAVEQTRGVSLETKAAAAALAPLVVSLLGLSLVVPLLSLTLPAILLGGAVPLAWPFGALSAILALLLLWQARWPVVGLVSRAFGAGGRYRAVSGAVEGWLTFTYLLLADRLLGGAVVPLVGGIAGPTAGQGSALVLSGLVLLAGLVVFARLVQTGGSLALLGGLVFVGGVLALLPSEASGVATSVLGQVPLGLPLGIGVVLALLVARPSLGRFVGQIAGQVGVSLARASQPRLGAEEQTAIRRQASGFARALLDLGMLLLGFALLQAPLLALLRPWQGPLVGAIILTGIAALIWLVLVVRLEAQGGSLGLLLGLFLGAPLLLTLPILDPQVLGVSWPATLASWGVGLAFLVVLVLVRSPLQAASQRALAPRLDRGLLGTALSSSEEASARRVDAVGELIGALLDLGLLGAAYWLVGLPLVATLGANAQPWLGPALLAGVILAAIGLVWGRVQRASHTLAETTESVWLVRARALPGIALALIALLLASCSSTPVPVAIASAQSTVSLLQAPRTAGLILNWDYLTPRTPATDQATLTLAFSCADGRWIGQFQEAFRPADPQSMPLGTVGFPGVTGATCDQWQEVYFARRRAAGLPDQPSVSWGGLDVRVTLNPDGSADVVETHRVLFTFGHFDHLQWAEQVGSATLSQLAVQEGGVSYPLGTADSSGRRATLDVANGLATITWYFPSVASPSQRTFVLRYHLANALQAAGAGHQVQLQLLTGTLAGPVWAANALVIAPTPVPPGQATLTSTGVDAITSQPDPRSFSFAATNVPANATWQIAVTLP